MGLAAKRVDGVLYWLHTDRVGSIQAVTDGGGDVEQRMTYRPYGNKIDDETEHTESRGYIGQRQDLETGLFYLHARYYDPELGLFLSPDPLLADVSSYGYGWGDPIDMTDSSGLEPDPRPVFPGGVVECPHGPGTGRCVDDRQVVPANSIAGRNNIPLSEIGVTVCLEGICMSEDEGGILLAKEERRAQRAAQRLERQAATQRPDDGHGNQRQPEPPQPDSQIKPCQRAGTCVDDAVEDTPGSAIGIAENGVAADVLMNASSGGCMTIGARFWDNFSRTNTGIPGLLAPTGLGLASGAGRLVAGRLGGVTVMQGIEIFVAGTPNATIASGNAAWLLRGAATSGVTFLMVGGAFEAGVAFGSGAEAVYHVATCR